MVRKLLLALIIVSAFCSTVAYAEFTLDFFTFNAAYTTYYQALLRDEGLSHPQGLTYTPNFAPSGEDGYFSSNMTYGTIYLNPYGDLSVDGAMAIVYDQAWSEEYNYFASSSLFSLILALEFTPNNPDANVISIGEAVINSFYDFLPKAKRDQAICYTGNYIHELFDLGDGRIALLSWRNDGTPDYKDKLRSMLKASITECRLSATIDNMALSADPYMAATLSVSVRKGIASGLGLASWLDTYKYDALIAAADEVSGDIDALLALDSLTDQDLAIVEELSNLETSLRHEAWALSSR